MLPLLGNPSFGRGLRQPQSPWKDQKENSTHHQLGAGDQVCMESCSLHCETKAGQEFNVLLMCLG